MTMRVYLISRSHLDWSAVEQFLHDHSTEWRLSASAKESEQLVELAGRVCYFSFGTRQSPRTTDEYIENLIAKGHESVLEHATWTFLITGVSRALTHQLVRHRVGFAFSQLSQQYHDETEAEFVEPPELSRFPELRQIWEQAVSASKDAYQALLRELERLADQRLSGLRNPELRRAIRSAARSVLPNATESKIVVTANARALRYFFKVRGAIEGDFEMRTLAAELFRLVAPEAPALFSDFRVETRDDGNVILVHDELAATRLGITS